MGSPSDSKAGKWTVNLGGPDDLLAVWEAFASVHPQWHRQTDDGEPVCCLPNKVIQRLKPCVQAGRAVLNVKAEQAFMELCGQHRAVGFWRGRPVEYPCLMPSLPLPAAGMQRAGCTSAQQLDIEQARLKGDEVRQRLKGYAGRLLTEPDFLGEADALARRWRELPEHQRPGFPLHPAMRVPTVPVEANKAPREIASFVKDFGAFCDRWSLISMATWHLPVPQGPLIPNPLPRGAPAMPSSGVELSIPPYYPVKESDALTHEVLQQQKVLVQEHGLDSSVAGLAHSEAYGQMLHVLHVERTLASRLGLSKLPYGCVSRLEAALVEILRVGPDMIKKLRKAISACRRGRRSHIRWLQPRVR